MKFALFVLCAVLLSLPNVANAKTIRAYHIGNSLTDNIGYGGLGKLATSKHDTYTFGKDVSPGVPLDMTWEGKTKTGSAYSYGSYGLYDKALKNYTWDAMTLEPFDNQISGSTGDLKISEDFINYAAKKSPHLQTYIYSRWPRRPQDSSGNFLSFNYDKLWTTSYKGSSNRYDLSDERKGYFETLVSDLNHAMPKLQNSVKMVPVGDVFDSLDKQIKAKKLKGISNITQFYTDDIHMNKTGSYVIALTFFATMFDQTPVGSTVPGAYGSINSTLAKEIQSTVWTVVSHNPYSGVNQGMPRAATLIATDMSVTQSAALGALVPEPTMLVLISLLPILGGRRRH
jgi:hypothetical protein